MNLKNGNTYIVRTSAVNKYEKTIPKFKLFINKAGDALLDISKLPEESIRDEIMSQTNTIVDLLKSFQKKNMMNNRNEEDNKSDEEDTIPVAKKSIKKKPKPKLKLI